MRIAVMGFSKGDFASLYSSTKRFQRQWGTPGIEFAATFLLTRAAMHLS
jgi:hypothetical protein